ncbi:MAG TPA: PilZ domain-containing protein [Rhizobium sp.]|nr:PilZ domain-containing protein [Rhizobium sp.]
MLAPFRATHPPETMDDDRRKHSRFPACWRVRIICLCDGTDEREVIEGRTCNISVAGICVLSQSNLRSGKTFQLELSVPPLNPGAGSRLAQLQGRACFTVLTSNGFRTGIEFVAVSSEDRRTLEHHLKAHHGERPATEHSLCG